MLGSGFVPDQAPMKPKFVDPPGAREPFQAAFFAVTEVPLVVTEAPHD